MKKLINIVIVLSLVLNSLIVFAEINNAGFEGGIHKNEFDYRNEKQYKEVVFLSGQPIIVYGKVKITVKDDKITYSYDNLTSKDKSVTLNRKVEFERIIDDSVERQTVEVNNITKFSEQVTIGNDTYELVDYLFHNSKIDDKQPVIDYYLSNWQGVKVYFKNDDKKIEVNITGDIYGYNQYWGKTETQKIKNYIRQLDILTEEVEWYGNVDIDVSFNRTKRMEYFENLPYQTSFDGGYTLTEKEETVMSYSYNLPYFENNTPLENIRNIGEGVETFETLPTQKKMFIPKYNDIKGRWSESHIKRLAGLKVIDGTYKFFGPKLISKRVEFAKWIVRAMNLIDENKQTRSYTKPELTPDLFKDVTKDNPDYEIIKIIKDRGIMVGTPSGNFLPDGNLTRAQAITIVIRALGLQKLAPVMPFKTKYKDDKDIPLYAKPYIYVATELGLVEGTPSGYVYPNEPMTKEEAAAFVNRFIEYLQEDIKNEYREGLINYK